MSHYRPGLGESGRFDIEFNSPEPSPVARHRCVGLGIELHLVFFRR
jgi:hypothetical protein